METRGESFRNTITISHINVHQYRKGQIAMTSIHGEVNYTVSMQQQ